METKKHNLVYKTTNLVNGKIYIGRHVTNRIDDGYLGSGTEFLEDVKKWGKKYFERVILFDFDNPEEMFAKEIELLTEEFILREDTYNITIGGSGGMLGKTHDEETRQRLREVNTGIVSVIDSDGNYKKVSVNDPRYVSGELKHNTKGTVVVKDKTGKKFRVSVDDPRRLSGELVGMNTGNTRPKETTKKHEEFMKDYWGEHKHSEDAIKKMRDANKGKVTVKDIDGNSFRVAVDDERYLSGELVNAYKGTKQSEATKQMTSESKKGCIWISNVELKKTKYIKPEQLEDYLKDGWIKYRMFFKTNKILRN